MQVYFVLQKELLQAGIYTGVRYSLLFLIHSCMYRMAVYLHQEKIFANFATALIGEIFIREIFVLC